MARTTNKKYRRNNKRNKRHTKRNSRHRKTRKLSKKGGDIMYYPTTYGKGDRDSKKNMICSDDNNVCLAFGDLSDKVTASFNGFVDFNYARKYIKRIGAPSENGFVFEIENARREYSAYSILKSARESTSDNLMYEYVVGQYVNKLNKLYPCFLETYGLFKYKTDHQWESFLSKKVNSEKKIEGLNVLKDALVQQPIDYAAGCKDSKHLAILIQHLPRPKSLEELSTNIDFIDNELLYALFQLYIPLAQLMNTFTHYDLHLGNVLLYKPVEGKYIEYHYHDTPTMDKDTKRTGTKHTGTKRTDAQAKSRTTNTAHAASMEFETITFKSSYILKIIDYGRSYFYDDERNNALKVYQKICKTKDCNKETSKGTIECGASYGLSWLEDDSKAPADSHFISSQHRNISHDLLVLDRIYKDNVKESKRQVPDDLYKGLLEKVMYEEAYGTYHAETAAMTQFPTEINNVQDAAIVITDFVKNPKYVDKNNYLYRDEKNKLGDLHIYMDGSKPMEFIPS